MKGEASQLHFPRSGPDGQPIANSQLARPWERHGVGSFLQPYSLDGAVSRPHRLGASKDVFIHIPFAVHPEFEDQSFDIKLHDLLERKRALSRDMLTPPESADDATALFESVARSST
ncbi:hypothetical protein [Methylocystis sp. ATCC 49242]|uniref:hypothetical protein n=1 Tax=Methylocystis sp. ATCC 49242 TaxID=622637 RepID=UPI00130ED991|nr:hypothetical protein [Methylocystis sp. ATCC 49242]